MGKTKEFKSGFVGIIGRPNVGKSTLVNSFVQQKIAITSTKPQTTRHKIRCIVTKKNTQVVFIDTPGFHKPKDSLGEHLNRAVRNTLKEVDVVVFVVDAAETIGKGDTFLANELKRVKTPIILVLNKIDKIKKGEQEAQIGVGRGLGQFASVIPLSARTGKNIDRLLKTITSLLPPGPKYYPDEQITDQPEALVIAELIREKVLRLTGEEVPYSVAVEVEDIEQRKDKQLIDVFSVIFVERESQKGILIGKGGSKLKSIGQTARREIENLLGSQINLQLQVKTKKNWRRDEQALHKFGYS